MRLIWSKGATIFSKTICYVCKEDCSHFSFILYDGKPGEILFQSNLLGCHPQFVAQAMKGHTIVHEKKYELDQGIEDMVWDRTVKLFAGKGYDYLGAIYLGQAKFKHTRFGIAMPDVNKWSQPDQFYCDALYEIFDGIPGLPQIKIKGGMKTPHDLWSAIDATKSGV